MTIRSQIYAANPNGEPAQNKRISEYRGKNMSNFICHINLDYEPDKRELAFILNNADDFCNKLELIDINFDSVKICIDSPKQYRICEREVPFEMAVPFQEDEEEEENFFEADTCWEEEDDETWDNEDE